MPCKPRDLSSIPSTHMKTPVIAVIPELGGTKKVFSAHWLASLIDEFWASERLCLKEMDGGDLRMLLRLSAGLHMHVYIHAHTKPKQDSRDGLVRSAGKGTCCQA